MRTNRNRACCTLLLAFCLAGSPALAVDTMNSPDAPDLTSVRTKLKAADYRGALAELKVLADTNQHADVYSLMGFALRKTGDRPHFGQIRIMPAAPHLSTRFSIRRFRSNGKTSSLFAACMRKVPTF